MRFLARDDQHVLYSRVLRQDGLDFAQLHAHAADLYLLVEAPEVFEGPIGEIPGQVPGAVEPGCGFLGKGMLG